MRVPQAVKDESHARIVENAAKLLRSRGVEATSVGDVMAAAGMTHGGFYRHFADKAALVVEAMAHAFGLRAKTLAAGMATHGPAGGLAEFTTQYLSAGHVQHPEFGCPVAGFAVDAARGGDALQAAYGAGLRQVIKTMASGMNGGEAEAARRLAMLAGAVMLARGSDAATAEMILAACKAYTKSLP